MPQLPKILSCREVQDSRLFRVDRAELEFSNGERRTYEYLKSGESGAVIIVPLLDNNTVLLVQEYGIGVRRYEWSLPKGKIDPGETALEAANRELKEEAGYGARRLDLLKSMSQSPNYMQHQTHIVLARDLYPESLPGDEPEPLALRECSLTQLAELVMQEDVTEARTIAALYLVKDWLRAQA